jgi:hypothetical protein
MAGGRRQRLSGAARCKFDDPELVGKLDALAKAGEKKGGNTKKKLVGAGGFSTRGVENRSLNQKRTRGSGFPSTPGKSIDISAVHPVQNRTRTRTRTNTLPMAVIPSRILARDPPTG